MHLEGAVETNEIHGLLWVENLFIFSKNKICSVHLTSTSLTEVTALTQNAYFKTFGFQFRHRPKHKPDFNDFRTNQDPGKHEEYVKMTPHPTPPVKSEYCFCASSK